jgi:hypothetical protein
MSALPDAFPTLPVLVRTGDGTEIDMQFALSTWRTYAAVGPDSTTPDTCAVARWSAFVDVTLLDVRLVVMALAWNTKTPAPTIAAALAQAARAYVQWQCAPIPGDATAIIPPLTVAVADDIRNGQTVETSLRGAAAAVTPLADAESPTTYALWVPGYFAGWTPTP